MAHNSVSKPAYYCRCPPPVCFALDSHAHHCFTSLPLPFTLSSFPSLPSSPSLFLFPPPLSPSLPLATMPCTSGLCRLRGRARCLGSSQLSILMRRSNSKSFTSSSEEGMLNTLHRHNMHDIQRIKGALLNHFPIHLSSENKIMAPKCPLMHESGNKKALTTDRRRSLNVSLCHPSCHPAALHLCCGREHVSVSARPCSKHSHQMHTLQSVPLLAYHIELLNSFSQLLHRAMGHFFLHQGPPEPTTKTHLH